MYVSQSQTDTAKKTARKLDVSMIDPVDSPPMEMCFWSVCCRRISVSSFSMVS